MQSQVAIVSVAVGIRNFVWDAAMFNGRLGSALPWCIRVVVLGAVVPGISCKFLRANQRDRSRNEIGHALC